ncbi:hypothetical protein PICSAR240_01763 [Mycobacterium avium subsp. paratuberculosis]|uniref:Uncharacterized protein n=5 Tax=Mycobacterium avium TaxID=1764 RepID=Q743T0_MYCPA|nr:hypothetical protein [Mycobacterium avium]ELP47783.1 hypothetical protein D522_03067 [Mycobacterium avium subsp. paratuberculosis S5]ETA98360.1 membrane protein [Mycobacterium avium subsp. paratuberculosis 10-4404]ETB09824.1 membrane protein [Mycobacterium avium subsp. paratuberculosis 08-8281]ETB29285.1 membrane protein [Mycobacterium avium subsp. paratuberculosis 10-5975]AAS02828.1 hypothetical protein MAP_0511c [Mycobacterium avium subsp. paratuberculosis K-10]
MSAVAVLLTALGMADLCRRAVAAAWVPLAVGPIVVAACAALGGLWRGADIALLALAAVAVVAWEWLCARSELSGAQQAAPVAVLAAALVSLTVLSGWSSPVAGAISRWSAWAHLPLSHVPPTRALMVVGVVLVQFATANQLVRLVLGSVGAVRPAGQPQPSDRLKGGRLLGPMERLLILSLGVGGQLAAASAVVAAKGIIRFPELNAQKGQNGDVGIDEVTEYFLVGSFTSWLLALGGIGLVLATR